MELSLEDKQYLKNYSAINPNIVFREGKQLSTISEAKNILSTVTLDCEIPQEVGIYDLNEFLNVMDLIGQSTNIEFKDTHMIINEQTGLRKMKYYFTDVEMLTSPTEKMINNARNMDSFEVNFKITENVLADIRKAASVLSQTSLSISPGDNTIILSVIDIDNPTSNVFTTEVAGESTGDFNYIINVNNIKVIPGDYEVKISSRQLSHFKHLERPIEYWIALEKTSKLGE